MKTEDLKVALEVGVYVEIEKDYGCASNAPWCNRIHSIEGDTYYFNEGSEERPYLVGYKLDLNNFLCVARKTVNSTPIYIFTH